MKTLALCLLTLALTACTTDSSGPAPDALTDAADSADAPDAAPGPCVADSECARGTTCERGACEVRLCEAKTDCGVGRICIAETGRCSAWECLDGSECAEGQSCDQGLCVEGCAGCCTSRVDCAATAQVCNLLTEKCMDPEPYCERDDDCVHPRVCDMTSRVCKSAP